MAVLSFLSAGNGVRIVQKKKKNTKKNGMTWQRSAFCALSRRNIV